MTEIDYGVQSPSRSHLSLVPNATEPPPYDRGEELSKLAADILYARGVVREVQDRVNDWQDVFYANDRQLLSACDDTMELLLGRAAVALIDEDLKQRGTDSE